MEPTPRLVRREAGRHRGRRSAERLSRSERGIDARRPAQFGFGLAPDLRGKLKGAQKLATRAGRGRHADPIEDKRALRSLPWTPDVPDRDARGRALRLVVGSLETASPNTSIPPTRRSSTRGGRYTISIARRLRPASPARTPHRGRRLYGRRSHLLRQVLVKRWPPWEPR